MKIYKNIFCAITAPENLFTAWDEFKSGKREKRDVQVFEWHLEQNIFALHRELCAGTYRHRPYTGFYICDPKPRHIHKASVRDRIVHHAIYSVINPLFEPTFISTSFSCRIGYGTHKGVDTLRAMMRTVSKNNTKPCWVLKCDIRKFFDSVDHEILISILENKIKDAETTALLETIIESYCINPKADRGRGIPIGNLTSQLFANVYMNEFDQFMKHTLRVKHYVRYTDDFVIVGNDPKYLKNLLSPIAHFLKNTLQLELHPNKSTLLSVCQGIDFLGYITFPDYRLLRTKTRHRLIRKLKKRIKNYETGTVSRENIEASIQSYLGILSHANTYRLKEDILNQYWGI